MDSLTNVMIATLLCFLTMVPPSTATTTSPLNVTLIQSACNETVDHELCLNHLSKNPLVVSASQGPSPLAIAAAIAESGLADAEEMHKYAANKVARSPAVKTAYAECAGLLDGTTLQLRVAVNILKQRAALTEMGASDDASESLLTSIDGVAGCMDTLDSVKVEDQYVKTSCKEVMVYSVAANSILRQLKYNITGKSTN